MDGCGLTTGNTALDALVIALLPILTWLAQYFGLLPKPAPKPPEPAPQPTPQPVALTGMPGPVGAGPSWLLLLLPLLEAIIKNALDMLRERLNREPTEEEKAREIKRVTEQFRRGRMRFFGEGLADDDLEGVTGGKVVPRKCCSAVTCYRC